MPTPGAAPARLGRYELVARLASGGMGEIFLARMEGAAGFEKLFVIKRILPHLADDVRFRDMLIAEARIASMMSHANVCQVYELGETDGQLYIVMEYLEGATLLPLLRKASKENAPLDFGLVAGVLQQATDGLHYAHELKDRSGSYLGIVHRDITPSNIFLTDTGVVKVLDFGIAKVKDASANTQTGVVKGKYAYMSPEQLRGAPVDRRSDVFALGVVTYEMLALRRLFQRKTDYLTFRAVMEQPIIDIRHYRPDCPDALAMVLISALDREPAHRYATARQFGTAVLEALGPVRRAWSQGEISDLITHQFADDLHRRSAQLVSLFGGGSARQTMPMIVQPDDPEISIDDDDEFEFPPVDSAVAYTPAVGREVDPSPLRLSSSEIAMPPMPSISFAEPTGSGPQLEALRAVPGVQPVIPPPQIVMMQPRRSVVWPLIAIAMVLVAGGALFLVWTQMQHQQQQPTSVVVTPGEHGRVNNVGPNTVLVGVDNADNPPLPPGSGNGNGNGNGSGNGSGSAATGNPATGSHPGSATGNAGKRPAPNRPDPYNVVIHTKQADVNRCVTEHGKPLPGTRLVIVVGPDGHTKQVSVEGTKIDDALGACIKDVFRAAVFPHDVDDHTISVNLRPV